ncbi:DUF427 domain-containing protein [Actinoplanes sp. TBRC 11911]|uniref:DUF427 domain-containing protein n=1 Tax=Actinoplanes sp. TBRC 11911 TaxID=2729386 RepID=UPI00145ED4C9|nr:DUF427 domain-containing protein [Actinoplanes sp. TBRC 11911]NMO53791.1 DUF427 domain-containing protein [Actinoplanes sp. TBRC 11911]
MQATINGKVIAEATDSDIVRIEGNAYFPPSSLVDEALTDSDTPYTCPWKGVAQYHDVTTPDGKFADAAWSYPTPRPGAIKRVGHDFSGYVAFDRNQVEVH